LIRKLQLLLLISIILIIPSYLISKSIEVGILLDNDISSKIIKNQTPEGSSVYYEDTTGEAWGAYMSGDYAYVADRDSGLAIIDISDPTNHGTPVYEDTTGSAN